MKCGRFDTCCAWYNLVLPMNSIILNVQVVLFVWFLTICLSLLRAESSSAYTCLPPFHMSHKYYQDSPTVYLVQRYLLIALSFLISRHWHLPPLLLTSVDFFFVSLCVILSLPSLPLLFNLPLRPCLLFSYLPFSKSVFSPHSLSLSSSQALQALNNVPTFVNTQTSKSMSGEL